MEGRIIVRGVLVGALGGLLAFIFARIFAEPVIGRAIDYESGRDDARMALGPFWIPTRFLHSTRTLTLEAPDTPVNACSVRLPACPGQWPGALGAVSHR